MMKRMNSFELDRRRGSFTTKVIRKNEEYIEKDVQWYQIKTKTPKFYGSVDPERLVECIEDIQYYFDLHEIEGSERVNISHSRLRIHAYECW